MAQDQHSCASKHTRSNAPESQPAAPTSLKVTKPGVSSVPLSPPPTEPQLQPVTSGQKVVEEVLHAESGAFALDSNNIRCIH